MSDPDLCPHEPDQERRLTLHSVPNVTLAGVGSEPVSFRWDRVTMRNPFWRLYLTDRSGIHLNHAGKRFAYPTDAIAVIPAWMRFTFHVVPDVGHTWIHFETPSLPSTVVERRWPTPFIIPSASMVDDLRRLGKRLAFSDDHRGLVLDAHTLATQAWCHILRENQQGTTNAVTTGGGRLDAVLAHIENTLARPVAIADLAAIADVGPEQLTRLFRGEFRTSPGQFLLERRVSRAADLLLSTNLSLDAIAQACGLGNRRYCSRVFSARMGMPPIRYRAAYRGSR